MATERISPIVHVRPAPPEPGAARERTPAAGDVMHLQFSQTQGDDLLAASGDGPPLRLSGLSGLGQELSEGDVLLVRVLAAAPDLDLEFLGTVSRSNRAQLQLPPAEQASMCLDQAALRQIYWREPNAATLAAAWRVLVYGRWREDRLPELGLPGAYLMLAGGDKPTLPSGIDRWSFPFYAWGGQQMMLRLVQGEGQGEGQGEEQGEEQGEAARRRSHRLALVVELDLPGLGPLMLLLQWVGQGLALTLRVRSKAALHSVRAMLPEISATLARADLQLLRCRLVHGAHAELVAPDGDDLAGGPSAAVSASLFRAAAETVVVLAAGAAAISPASR